jgi:hypothetical protein
VRITATAATRPMVCQLVVIDDVGGELKGQPGDEPA